MLNRHQSPSIINHPRFPILSLKNWNLPVFLQHSPVCKDCIGSVLSSVPFQPLLSKPQIAVLRIPRTGWQHCVLLWRITWNLAKSGMMKLSESLAEETSTYINNKNTYTSLADLGGYSRGIVRPGAPCRKACAGTTDHQHCEPLRSRIPVSLAGMNNSVPQSQWHGDISKKIIMLYFTDPSNRKAEKNLTGALFLQNEAGGQGGQRKLDLTFRALEKPAGS